MTICKSRISLAGGAACLLVLASCGPVDYPGASSENSEAGVAAEDPKPAEMPTEQVPVVRWERELLKDLGFVGMGVPPEFGIEFLNGSTVNLSGTVAEPNSTGSTNGIRATIDEEMAESYKGKKIIVEIDVVSSEAVSQDFMVAYSTAGGGGSGWNTFTATPDKQSFSFEFSVPTYEASTKDFIGIIPDANNTGNAITASSLKIYTLVQK